MTIDPTIPAEPIDPETDAPLPEQPETDVADQEATATAIADTAPADDGNESSVSIPAVEPVDEFATARTTLAAEIRASRRLPRGLRERLAQAVETEPATDIAAAPTLRVAEALALLEESLPPQLVLAAETLERATHPAGDGFFSGDPRRFSASEAARIAAEQLAATGFGKRG